MESKIETQYVSAVQEKYYKLLKLLMKDVHESWFKSSIWMKTHKIDNHFIEFSIKLGFIRPINRIGTRTIFVPLYEPEKITLSMAILLLNEIRNFIRENRNKITKDIKTNLEEKQEKAEELKKQAYSNFNIGDVVREVLKVTSEIQKPILSISELPIQEIIDEIKRRGYTGTIEKLEEYKL
jgi:hypothetical protein